MGFIDEIRMLCKPDSDAHEKKTEEILTALRELTSQISFGYSPLRRIIVYEIYRFLLGVNGQPHVRDFFEKLEIYPFHRDRLAARFAELEAILVPIPESKEEVDLQLLALDEEVFCLPDKEYKGVVCTEIDAQSFPKIAENQGYGVNYNITTAQGQKIEIDSKIALIDSHKGDGKRLVIFALPGEKHMDYKAVFAIWKDFYKMLSPLKEPEDIFLAIYEYYHYSSPEFQSFVDDHTLIEEYALELSFVATLILKSQSFVLGKESVISSMRGKWPAFHGSRMLVNDFIFLISMRLGYLQPIPCVSNLSINLSVEMLNWKTFPMKSEIHLLAELAEANSISVSHIRAGISQT